MQHVQRWWGTWVQVHLSQAGTCSTQEQQKHMQQQQGGGQAGAGSGQVQGRLRAGRCCGACWVQVPAATGAGALEPGGHGSTCDTCSSSKHMQQQQHAGPAASAAAHQHVGRQVRLLDALQQRCHLRSPPPGSWHPHRPAARPSRGKALEAGLLLPWPGGHLLLVRGATSAVQPNGHAAAGLQRALGALHHCGQLQAAQPGVGSAPEHGKVVGTHSMKCALRYMLVCATKCTAAAATAAAAMLCMQ